MANSTLGTLLATRLDAVLGTTLAQHPVLLTGAKSHNVAQATSAIHPQDTVIQRGSGQAAEVGARRGQPDAASVARGGASATGLPSAKSDLPGGIQPSARAILSEPARTILALLLSRGDTGAGVQGRVPLWDARTTAAQRGGAGAAGAATAGASRPGSAAGAATGAATATATATGAGAGAGAGASSVGPAAGAAASSASPADAAKAAAPLANTGQAGSTAEANAAARLAAISAGLSGKNPAAAQASASAGANGATLKAPEGMVRMLAQALGQTVSHSGLFYESHLAQMVFGKRGLAELLKEPQALLGRSGGVQASSSAGTATVFAGGSGNAPGAAAGGGSAHSNMGAQASHAAGSGAGTAGASTAVGLGSGGLASFGPSDAGASLSGANASSLNANLPVPGIHPDATPLVRQQLETLANNAFHWQGEAWPGASMQWEVNEDASGGGATEPSTWATRLKLELPSLGDVEARISLAGNQLVVRLVAPESAATLQEQAPVLRQNLSAGGLTLTDLTVLAQAAAGMGPAADTGAEGTASTTSPSVPEQNGQAGQS